MVLTCLPEELPVAETIEATGALRAAELPLGAVVANQVTADHLASRGSRLPALAREPAPLLDAATRAGTRLDKEAVTALLEEARDRQRQVTRERRLLKELRAKLDGLPVVELPMLEGGATGPEAVRALAALLADSPLTGSVDGQPAGQRQGRRAEPAGAEARR
jgi:anion-transporting  ArsA/GET3 family ATPase